MKFLTALTTALLMTLSPPAWADVSRDDAAATAQRSSGGRVLAVDRAEQGGRAVWRVILGHRGLRLISYSPGRLIPMLIRSQVR